MAAFLLVEQEQTDPGGLRQSDSLALTGVELLKIIRNARYVATLQPMRSARHPFPDRGRRLWRLKLAQNRTGDQNMIEESGKEILNLYENEIIDRRGVRNNSH